MRENPDDPMLAMLFDAAWRVQLRIGVTDRRDQKTLLCAFISTGHGTDDLPAYVRRNDIPRDIMDSYTLTPEEKAYVAGSDMSALPASLEEIRAAIAGA
jgi:hypothetical protein